MIVRRGKPHRCGKPHPFQDARYDGGRVANRMTKNDGRYYRCTVCGGEFEVSAGRSQADGGARGKGKAA